MSIARKYGKIGLLLAGSIALSGCATTDCDPGRGGFLRGIGCSVSGSYGERQQQKQTAVGGEQQTQTGLKREYERTNREVEETTAERQALEREYAQLQDQIDGLNAKLAKSKSDTSALRRNIKGAQNQLDLLKTDTLSPKSDLDRRRAALDKRVKELEREVDMARQR